MIHEESTKCTGAQLLTSVLPLMALDGLGNGCSIGEGTLKALGFPDGHGVKRYDSMNEWHYALSMN